MKQMLVVRKDLNMRKGKMIAQGAHASMLVTMFHSDHPFFKKWISGKFTKIAVGVDSEEELLSIHKKAEKLKWPTALVTDAGLTEFHGEPTNTVVAIGPAPDELVNELTGHLKLL